MSFQSDSFQALGVGVGDRLDSVTAALSLGVGHNGEIGTYLISVNIGTYCELLSGWHQSGFLIRRELVKGDFWAIFYIETTEVLILNLDSRIIQLQTWALNPQQINQLSRTSATSRQALLMKNARSTWQWTSIPDLAPVPWAQGQFPRAPGWPYGQSPSYPGAWKKPILCQTIAWNLWPRLFKAETTNLEKEIGRQTSIIKTVLSF